MMMENRRILMIGNFGSASRRTRGIGDEFARQLKREGWDVYCASSRSGRVEKIADMALSVYRLRKKYDTAVVEVYSGRAFIWAEAVSFFLKRLGKRLVLVLHGGGLPQFAPRHTGRVKRLLHSADVVLTPSKMIRESLAGFRDDIEYLPNGIETSRFHYRPRITPSPRICWLRAFHEIYEPALAVEILSRLRSRFPSITLTMAGPDKGALKRVVSLAESRGVSDCLQMKGPVDKDSVPEFLNQHDIFLNTTTLESFGVSVMEAALSGLCIVSSRAGEIPRLWAHEKDVLLFDCSAADDAARQIERILTEPALAGRLSENARRRALEFDWAEIMPRWLDILRGGGR